VTPKGAGLKISISSGARGSALRALFSSAARALLSSAARALSAFAPAPALFLATALALALLWAPGLSAQTTALDLFMRLPDSEANGLTAAQRQAMRDSISAARGYSPPSTEGFWLESRGPHSVTLFGVHHMPAVYKFFPGSGGGAGLLGVCRSLQTSGPAAADERPEGGPDFDLTLYQAGAGMDLVKADQADYLPPIGVLDFTTMDTMADYYARKDLEIINQHFRRCLTCHASAGDSAGLDILTVTSISGASCASFITHYKLLPLTWNGRNFDKPYDRAASPDEPWPRRDQPRRGIYYQPPASGQ
jgi:hypothetical protein